MKVVLSIVFLFNILVNADEIQRIESMVKDISQLKDEYKTTEQKLHQCSNRLQNGIVKESEFEKKEKKYIKRIKDLENQLKIARKKAKIKEVKKTIIKTKIKKCLINQSLEKENPFPKLQLKKEFQEKESKIEFFKPSSFRVNKEADIYDSVYGKVIETWEDKTSFTSNQKNANWIKITGYFVDKQWKPAEKEMWIKIVDLIDRDQVLK